MKKFLSLVLALVMTMSLVTISAGAKDFTDDDSITYDEAIDVMSAVKVVEGYPDGSFNPEKTLTRAEAAKVICNMVLGPTTASALSADTAPFTDVPTSHWAAGYIAYCAKQSIINGYGDGKFGVNDPLTGYAFMKMLLTALGYDAVTEGYTGANWSINVAKRALYIGLDEDLTEDFDGTKPVTREEACLYAFNTLKAQRVEYTGGNSVTVNGITFTNGGQLQENQGLFRIKYFPKLTASYGTAKNGVPSTTWKYDRKTVGTYADPIDATYNKKVAEKTVYADLDLIDDTSFYKTKLTTTVSTSYQLIEEEDSTKIGKTGVVLNFYVDADNSRYYMTETHPIIKKISSISKNDDGERLINFAAGTINAYKTDDFAKGDYVILTTKKASTGVDVDTIVAAEKLSGKVTKLVGSDEVYIDGEKYTLSSSDGNDIDTSIDVKDEVEFYLDANGYILKIDKASNAVNLNNLAYVEKAGQSTDTFDSVYKAVLRLPDGTKKTVDTDVQYYSGANNYDSELVTYKLDSEGKTVLTQDADKYYHYAANADFTKGQPVVKGWFADYNSVGATDLVVTASTRFVYVTTNNGKTTVKTYDGYQNAPSFTDATNVDAYVKSGKAICVYVYADDSALTGESSDKTFVIFNKSADKVTEADIVDYYTLSVIENGTIKEVKLDASDWGTLNTSAATNNYYVTGLVSLRNMKDGSVQLGSSLSDVAHAAEIEVADDGATVLLDSASYAVASDVKVYVVNKDCDEVTLADMDAIADGEAGNDSTDTYKDIFYGLKESGKRIVSTIIVVEKW